MKTFIIWAVFTLLASINLHAADAASRTLLWQLKHQKEYSPTTTGPLLTGVLGELWEASHQSLAGQYKLRLTTGIIRREIIQIAECATTEREGKLLLLLYHTRPELIPHFLTDSGAKNLLEGHGSRYKERIQGHINRAVVTDDLINVLEEYSVSDVATIVDILNSSWFRKGPNGSSQASQAVRNATYVIRQNEFTKRSLVLRLLREENILRLPESFNVHLAWSGRNILIHLQAPEWSEEDVPELTRLLSNPYYGEMARSQLARLAN